MDILTQVDNIKYYLNKCIEDEKCELELIYGVNPSINPINKEIFLKLLSHLRDNYEFLHETNTLDINTQYIKHNKKGLGNVRCSVKGVDSIKK